MCKANVQPQIDVNALQGGRIAAAMKVNRIIVYSYRIMFFIAIVKIFMISTVKIFMISTVFKRKEIIFPLFLKNNL